MDKQKPNSPNRQPLNVRYIGLIHRRPKNGVKMALESCSTYRYSSKNTFRGKKITRKCEKNQISSPRPELTYRKLSQRNEKAPIENKKVYMTGTFEKLVPNETFDFTNYRLSDEPSPIFYYKKGVADSDKIDDTLDNIINPKREICSSASKVPALNFSKKG